MGVRAKRPPFLSVLLVVFIALGIAAAPGPAARASEPDQPDFYAWDLRVDFEGGATHAVLTTYNGMYDPPGILEWDASDISTMCQERGLGQIVYQNGGALFDGASFIRCELPAGIAPAPDQCETTALGNFWFSAEGTFQAASAINPMVRASNNSFSFGLPSNGTSARTRVQFPTYTYQSNTWPLDSAWNEVLMGQYGPLMLEATSQIPGPLENLDLSWEGFFQNVGQAEVGHRMFSLSAARQGKTTAVAIPYVSPPSYVDIGYNANTGAFFAGQLAYVEVDPPGCTAK